MIRRAVDQRSRGSARSRRLPARLCGWHGMPPMRPSTQPRHARPSKVLASLHTGAGAMRPCCIAETSCAAAKASLSTSTTLRALGIASSTPRSRPPPPVQMLMRSRCSGRTTTFNALPLCRMRMRGRNGSLLRNQLRSRAAPPVVRFPAQRHSAGRRLLADAVGDQPRTFGESSGSVTESGRQRRQTWRRGRKIIVVAGHLAAKKRCARCLDGGHIAARDSSQIAFSRHLVDARLRAGVSGEHQADRFQHPLPIFRFHPRFPLPC